MKKYISLIKACMTSDMSLFKIHSKKKNKLSTIGPLFIALYLMFMLWTMANGIFEKVSPLGLQTFQLAFFIFGVSIMTIVEGIYKTGPLIFNCKDDQLLLSLPIKRRDVVFVRIFKLYVFELLFNSLFLAPILVAYIRWGENITWTYFLTCAIMLFLLPVIPIIISCIIGAITSSLSSRFKYKNAAQIITSMLSLIIIFSLSFKSESLLNYLIKHATSLNDLITKVYYPAGVFANLITDFKVMDLIIFILVNIIAFVIGIYVLGKFYFRINSRLKSVTTTKKVNTETKLVIKKRSVTLALIKKELNTFFKTPVFIINAGFGLVLHVIAALIVVFKFDSVLPILTAPEPNGLNIAEDMIMNNLSLIIFLLILITSFMTSITSSIISLEGRNINILKSLPIKSKTVIMSKIYSCLVLTTPVLLIGNIILFIKFRINIIDILLLLVLSILVPLVSHFIGLIVNLKFPKLDWENTSEVVKQSMSSFVSVMIGMLLAMVSCFILLNVMGKLNSTLLLLISLGLYGIIDGILYLYIIKKSTKEFDRLSI